jgi:hypothetical protein
MLSSKAMAFQLSNEIWLRMDGFVTKVIMKMFP